MKNLLYVFLFAITVYSVSFAQPVTIDPATPTQYDSIVVFFDATQPGGTGLLNYTGTVYAHTGVNTNLGAGSMLLAAGETTRLSQH